MSYKVIIKWYFFCPLYLRTRELNNPVAYNLLEPKGNLSSANFLFSIIVDPSAANILGGPTFKRKDKCDPVIYCSE